jgi:hypothetical protein
MSESNGGNCSPAQAPVASKMTVSEFFAEAKRIGLTFEVFAAQLAARPEFADCLPTRAEQEQHGHRSPESSR